MFLNCNNINHFPKMTQLNRTKLTRKYNITPLYYYYCSPINGKFECFVCEWTKGHDPLFARIAFPSPNYFPFFVDPLTQAAHSFVSSLAGLYNVTGNLITIERQR